MNLPPNHIIRRLTGSTDSTEEEREYNYENSGALRTRKHVTSACFSCKSGKVKCDGKRPCIRCSSKGHVCIYRSDEDGRSRNPLRRRIEALERDNTVLHLLIDQIRGASDIEVQRIAYLIQSNAPLTEVSNIVHRLKQNAMYNGRQVDPMIDDIYTTTGRELARQVDFGQSSNDTTPRVLISPQPVSRVMSVSRLIDEPLHQVRAAPWTAVTRDDHLVSHLVSLWATWYHLLPDGIVLEPFLRAMKAARPDSPLCSPFLVNCILAAGCLFSDFEEAKTVQGKASDLMVAFVKEARWHLGQDPSTPSITNVQGLSILYVVVSQLHQDRDGYHYAVQAATMSVELFRERELILARTKSREERTEIAFVLKTACWGAYSTTTASISAWMRPQSVAAPQTRCPEGVSVKAELHATQWLPYPQCDTSQDIHLDQSLRSHYKLAVLTAEFTHKVYKVDERSRCLSDWESLHDLHVRLIFWYMNLPEYMKQDSPRSPAVTMLLIWYHSIVATLLTTKMEWRMGSQECDEKDDSEAEDEDEDADANDDDGGTVNNDDKEICVTASAPAGLQPDEDHLVDHALRIAALFRSTRDTYGYSRLHCFMCQPGRVALYILMERNTDSCYDTDITELFTAMRAMSRRFPFTFTLLRMTQVDLRLRNLDLPTSAERLFDEYEQLKGGAWKDADAPNSVYPSPQLFSGPYAGENIGLRRTKQPTNMIDFLKTFDGLKIG